MKSRFLALSAGLLCLLIEVVASSDNKEHHSHHDKGVTPYPYSLSTIQEQISLAEYHPSRQSHDFMGKPFKEPRLHFTNRKQNLRAYFDDQCIMFLPRDIQNAEPWSMELSFPRIPKHSKPTIIDYKICYRYDGVTQEYTNSPVGIEQNIIVYKNPQGHGNLRFDANIELNGLHFSHHIEDCLAFAQNSSTINFRILEVSDAQGKLLPRSITFDGAQFVSLVVFDEHAVYPIRISLLVSSQKIKLQLDSDCSAVELYQDPDWTAESDQSNSYFGISVASAGDVNNDGFDDVIVGASLYDNGQFNEGRAYVYHGSASGLSLTPDWIAESDHYTACFGTSVATAGDINDDGYSDIIIGAPCFQNGQGNEGRAYVYHGSVLGLHPTPAWTVESNWVGAYFGASVASAGDVNNDGYDDLIIGAKFYENGQHDEGRAYVYHGGVSGLSQTADWSVEGDWFDAHFGISVASAGDVNNDGYADVIIGAAGFSFGQEAEGRAFVYHGSASGLSLTPDWTAESDCDSAQFGISAAGAGDVNNDGYSDVIIGAPGFNNNQGEVGRAYVYHGSASGLSSTPNWIMESDQVDANFGISVASAGDFNNDGYSDVIIGANSYDNGENNEGSAYMYCGRSNGLPLFVDWNAEVNQIGARFGSSIATAGDINDDGLADIIIGAYAYDNGQINEGRAFVFHGKSLPLHNIQALDLMEPSEYRYQEFTVIQPSAVFRNRGFVDEDSVLVTCIIKQGMNTVYVSNQTILSFIQNTDTLVVFDEFTLGFCGSHYEVFAFSCLPQDTFYYDDTTQTRDFVAARLFELPSLECVAWKYPNADTEFVPYPTDSSWIRATPTEIQQISVLDSTWWVTAGAIDSAHQDLQLYGYYLAVADTLIEELIVEWWGHHGGAIHNQCVLYFWNNDSNMWSQRMDAIDIAGDAHFVCDVPADSFAMFVNSEGYFYVATAAQFSSCPLLFTYNGKENVFIGDIITGSGIGIWVDRVMGTNLYAPPDYDEYIKIDGDKLQKVDGNYRLSINEMLQEVSYIDEVKLYVIDHSGDYNIYPHETFMYPMCQGLSIHTSKEIPLKTATDKYGYDILYTLQKEDRIYAPFEKSGIAGFAKPFTITLDIGELENPESAVLYLFGSTRFQDSDEIQSVGDIYLANKQGLKFQNPKVEVINGSGKWKKVKSCGLPGGFKKTVTYPLYDEKGRSIFNSDDHRVRITFYSELYLDKVWVSCHTTDDYRVNKLVPVVADLHYYGYAEYHSPDGKYPGDYDYEEKVAQDYASVAGYYTKYGDVKALLDSADSKFVIMCHGDEISLEFNAEELPDLPDGWKRDFIFEAKGFYKMARPGHAFAYSVEPLPFYGMRDDLSADKIGCYPYDPSPGLLMSVLACIVSEIIYDYPFPFKDFVYMVKAFLLGDLKNTYPQNLTEYRQEWNTRHVSTYYPDRYTDLPPHLNLEGVPLHEEEGSWPDHLVTLGIPFGDHSLHSNYVRVWLVTTIPVAIKEKKFNEPLHSTLKISGPNLFRKCVRINYTIPKRIQVGLYIYDLNGRLVRTLINALQSPGAYDCIWDGLDDLQRKCPAGVYFVNFTAGIEYHETKKLLLIK